MSKVDEKIVIPTLPIEQILSPEQLKRFDEPLPTGLPSLAELVARITANTPDEEYEKLPQDFSKNLDHYLYGAAKDSDLDEDLEVD